MKSEKIHFVGVGGIGMSGLALLLAGDGAYVSGCDLHVAPPLARQLVRAGVKVANGHDAAHLRGRATELVVRTPAVGDDNPELAAARRRGIRIASRGEALADYANARETIAVCGTHGKTTTACFSAMLLRRLRGLRGTGWCIGGWTESLGGVARTPAPGAPFVIEADESDGTLALHSPRIAVVTSIERDHIEHFGSFQALQDCFAEICRKTRGEVIYCADDPVCRKIAGRGGAIGYGFSEEASLRAERVEGDGESSEFNVTLDGRDCGRVRLGVPGRHNVLNALGAIGAALALGHGIDEALGALGALRELPGRRFERFHHRTGFEIVSDYSHHPTEIRAMIGTAKACGKPVTAIFQPHRYTRTKAMLDDFARCFSALDGSDRLILLPVYPAFEKPIDGGTTIDLYARMRELNASCELGVVPELARDVDEVLAHLKSGRAATAGRLVAVIGAGDVVSLVPRLKRMRPVTGPEPAPFRVTFGVAAVADEVLPAADAEVLCAAVRSGRRVLALGQGSDLLPSPLGVRATVARLAETPPEFRECAEDGTVEVVAGCGMPGAKLLSELARRGLSGLEFMAGIPGTLGGWLAMNAGTRLGEVGDAVVEVEAVDSKGRMVAASRAGCGFSYRACRWLRGKIAWRARLRLKADSPEAVRERMRQALAKRFDFGGLRTAGSAFKNPPGQFAGALLEAAGCKGLRIGGAHVLDRHANIVAAGEGATASDIMALLETMRARVASHSGVDLQMEIRQW